MKPLLFALSLLCATLNQTQAAKAPTGEVREQITAGNNAWMAAFAKGDAAALAALYTENARMLPPGAEMLQGRPAIQKFVETAKSMGLTSIVLTTLEVTRTGPSTAMEIGKLTFEAPDAQKKLVRQEGKYVVNWRLVKGKWLLSTDIWNLNK